MKRDLIRQRYGKLVVVEELPKTEEFPYLRVRCLCDCNKMIIRKRKSVITGNITSCGCARKAKHHGFGTKLYRVWNKMKGRCLNSADRKYPSYGERGIQVCNEWLEFTPFRDWATSNGYQEGLSLDRIDNDGNYEPTNCRWITMKEQASNRRNTIHYKGTCLRNYCITNSISYQKVRARIRKGMSVDEAVQDVLNN